MLLTAGAIVKVKKKMQTKKIARKKWLFDIFKMTYKTWHKKSPQRVNSFINKF